MPSSRTPALRRGMLPEQLRDTLAGEHRAWARAELIERFGAAALRRTLISGAVVRILPGVYCAPRREREFVTRVSAASLWAAPQGLIGGRSALWIYGALTQEPNQVTVVAPRHTHIEVPPWIRVRRCTTRLRAEQRQGLRVTPIVDAVILGWEEEVKSQRIGLVVDAVRGRFVTVAKVQRRLMDYPQLRARRALRRLLIELEQGVESFLEHRAMTTAFYGPEFCDFVRQAEVRSGGQRYVLDMVHPAAGIAVELDGRRFHSDDRARRRDLERDANVAAVGILTIRFTYEDIMSRPLWCRERVLTALKHRTQFASRNL